MISRKAKAELELIRAEMQKENPDGEKIFKLMCGEKYTRPLYERRSNKKRN
jgi:hypothetical protein